MDLNYLFLRQQVERTLAEEADNDAAREAHAELARRYELEIERLSEGRIMFPAEDGTPLVQIEAQAQASQSSA